MVRGGPAPGFTVSAPDVTVTQGTTGTVPVTVNSSACFSGVATYSAATVGGVQMSPPAGTLAVNGVGSAVAGFSFFAPLSMAPGTYAGTATVSIGGISHAAAFSVKVVPNSTPYYTFTPFNSAPLVPGGSVTRYFVVQKQNGYNGVPVFSVNPAFLPAGISVVFSDGGKATYGTATATISAANAVVPNNGFSIPVDSSDGALSVSFPVGVQIVAAPLGVTYSVAYSNISSATKRGTVAVLTPRITGGTPPFTVTGTGLGAQSGTTFTTNGQADVTGTLTVTDTSGAVATMAATIPAAPVVSDAILASMAMERIAGLEMFAGQLVAAGRSDAALRAAFLAAAGVSAADYPGLRSAAMLYKSAQAGVKTGAGLALKPLLVANLLPETAPVSNALARTLRGYYNQGAGLAASSGASFLGAAGAGPMVASILGSGGGGPVLTFPGSCSDASICPQLAVDGYVQVDPGSGQVSGSAYAQLNGVPAVTQSYGSVEVHVDATLAGPGGWLDGDVASGAGSAVRADTRQLTGWATSSGQYMVSGYGDGTVEDGSLNGFYFHGNQMFRSRPARWDVSSCVPSVTGLTVDSVPTNAFVPGTSQAWRPAVVYGTCLLGVTSVSVRGLQGLSLTLGTVAFDQVNLTYRVDAGATASSGSVLLSAGSVTLETPARVETALPRIDAVSPGNWPSGNSTLVTISGVGFGTFAPTGTTAPVTIVGETTGQPLPYVGCWSVVKPAGCPLVGSGWSDTAITLVVTPPGDDPGEVVDVTVTGGTYSALGFQGQGSQKPAAQVGGKPRVEANASFTLNWQSPWQFQATATPPGGRFSQSVELVAGTSAATLTAIGDVALSGIGQSLTFTLGNPANPNLRGAPSPGGLARLTVTYAPLTGQAVSKQFLVPTFGMSCYFTALESDYFDSSGSCPAQVLTLGGQTRTYCSTFLGAVKLQGSGVGDDGTILQYSTALGAYVLSTQIQTADVTAAIADGTVARDRSIITARNVRVSLQGIGNSLRADDVGGPTYIQGYRLDLYRGSGKAVCANSPNPIVVASCTPGLTTCPTIGPQ